MKLIPVIMSGGVGSRLWPVSRVSHSKPFIPLPDGENLIQKTFTRACGLNNVAEVLTVTNRELFFKTEDEYQQSSALACAQSFILEPFGRNTAAAVAAAALHLESIHGADAQILVLAADHLIKDQQAFSEAVLKAQELAAAGWLVTFGIKPESPETGFGYIEAGRDLPLTGGMRVNRFVEKPDLATAKSYLESGNYYWNSGMFCFSVGTIIEEFERHAPEVIESVHAVLEQSRISESEQHRSLKLDAKRFATVPDISIDYALMERSENVVTVPCDIGWSDIGSWTAMSDLTDADDDGNRFEGEVMAHESKGNYVQSNNRLAALVGVDDLIVVDAPDAILVAHKDKAQDVKHIVSRLKQRGHDAHLHHQTAYRPWGTYTVLEEGIGFKIKCIVVKPGASLSLQMHHHRSEHWVVVSGTAKVSCNDTEFMLKVNESTFIPVLHKHRLGNEGPDSLIIVEVQIGAYLKEDDIVRFETDDVINSI